MTTSSPSASSRPGVPLIVGTLLFTLILGVVGLYRIQARLVAKTGENLETIAVGMASDLEQVLIERYNQVQALARLPLLNGSNMSVLTEVLTTTQQTHPAFHWLGVLDGEGEILASTDVTDIGQSIIGRPEVLAAQHKPGVVYVRDAQPAKDFAGIPTILLAVSSENQEGRARRTVLAHLKLSNLHHHLQTFHERLKDTQAGSVEWAWVVISQTGEILFDSHLVERDGVHGLDQALPSVKLVFSSQPGFVEEQDKSWGGPVLTGYARIQGHHRIPGLNWGVLIRHPHRAMLPPIHGFLQKLGMIAGLVFLPLVGVVLWEAGRLERQMNQTVEAETNYRHLFENAHEGIFQTSEEGRYLSANPALAQIYGYQNPQELMEELMNIDQQLYVDPERRMEFCHLMQKHGSVVEFESQIFQKDRTIRWISENAHAVCDPSGAVLHYEGMVEDITDRKQAEEARDRFFRLSPDMQCVLSFDGFFQRTNSAFEWTFGLTAEQLFSHPLMVFIHDDDWEHTESALLELASGKDTITFENRFRCADGTYRWLHWRAASFVDEGRIFAVAQDMTERKQEEEDRRQWEAHVRQAQKMEALGTLTGGIAHDFNNILTAILGFTQLSLMSESHSNKVRMQLDEILMASHRAKDLVKQLLTFSQPTDDQRTPVCLKGVVEETLKLLHATIPASVEIRTSIQDTNTTILADPNQVHQVLMNVCVNACQAMEGGGNLEIQLDEVDISPEEAVLLADRRVGPHVRLLVRDTGQGMSSEVLERVFDPFFTTKSKGQGTGLGLSVVHGIVKNHGGHILVQSVPQEGTTVQIFFPQTQLVAQSTASQESSLPKGHECVLFVDDEDSLCELGREFLTHLGYQVVAKNNSLDALETLKADPYQFDLVITDDSMPHMNGREMVQKLQEIRPEIPVLFCSGYSRPASSFERNPELEEPYILKPFDIGQLARAIRNTLDGRDPQV